MRERVSFIIKSIMLVFLDGCRFSLATDLDCDSFVEKIKWSCIRCCVRKVLVCLNVDGVCLFDVLIFLY